MKKIIYLTTILLAVTALSFTQVDPLPIGSPLPNPTVKMKDVTGKQISLGEAKGANGLLVMFSCNTCPFVIKNQDRTKVACDYATANKLGVVILNSNEAKRDDDDSHTSMKEYAKEQGYKWHYLVDNNSEMANAFGANRTPECFLFDKNGKLAYHGAIDNNPNDPAGVTREHLKEAITELLAGKEVSIKESRSVGCTIKRKG